MRHLSINNSLLYFLDELEYTEAALAADPDTSGLSPLFLEAIEEWDGVFAKERKGRRDVVRALAVMAVKNWVLDRVTRGFGGLVLLEADQNRGSTLFRRFFPKAPSVIIRWGLRKQCDHTLNIMVPEVEKLPAESPLKAFGARLKAAAQDGLLSLNERNKIASARAMTGVEISEWKEGVNRLRLSTYAELLRISAEKAYDKSWAESFFRSVTSAGTGESGDVEEPVDVATPDEPATDGTEGTTTPV
jgi:hypothetical protein